MGRMVRSLMKVPAVRRVMLRLANAEAAILKQQGELAAFNDVVQRLNADGAEQRRLLSEVPPRLGEIEAAIGKSAGEIGALNDALAQRQAEIGALNDALAQRQSEIAALNDALAQQQSEIGALNDALAQRQSEIGTLNATVAGQNARLGGLAGEVRTLAGDAEGLRALLAEVAQHLPPAQRANLEATLHGQQLQLGALNSTVNAQQMQLAALNDLVRQLTEEKDRRAAEAVEARAHISMQAPRIANLEGGVQALQASLQTLEAQLGAIVEAGRQKIAALEQENRILRVGHGATFEELAADGKTSIGTPYSFDELLSLREAPKGSAPAVPPVIFIHVPKAGGTTLNNILMRNFKYRADSHGTDFFPRYFPSEFNSLVEPPQTEDDRIRPMFFTGHIGLGNEVFRRMPVRYATITMLRDPVDRIVSHYRFNSMAPSMFQSAIKDDGLDVIEYFGRFRSAIPMQYEYFVLPGDGGNGAQTRQASDAIRNLGDKVSIFGLQDKFDEFVVLLSECLGLPDVFFVPLNKTPANAASVTKSQVSKLRNLLADDVEFYRKAVELYERRKQALPFNLEARVEAFGEEKKNYLDLRRRHGGNHPWNGYYS